MSEPSRSRHDLLAEQRSGEILDAAERVFARLGFERATIGEVAREAGVAKGTVYLYYPSKRDVYREALHRCVREVDRRTREEVAAAADVHDKVAAFVRAKVEYFEAHRDFFRIYFCQLGHTVTRSDALSVELEDLFLAQVRVLEEVLRAGIESGAVRRERPGRLAFAVFALTRDLVVQRLRGWSEAPMEEDVAAVVELVWKGIAAR